MRQITFIIILISAIACSKSNSDNLCFEVLNHDKANWIIDTDSIKTIDNLINYQNAYWTNKNEVDLIPQIITSNNRRLNISKVRRPLMCCIRRYDPRFVFKITVFNDKIEAKWAKDTSNKIGEVTNLFKPKISQISYNNFERLGDEIKDFYDSNNRVNNIEDSFFTENDYHIKELEVRILFVEKSLKQLPRIVEQVSQQYIMSLNETAKSNFGKEFCDIENSKQLDLLKKTPLKIYINSEENEINKGW